MQQGFRVRDWLVEPHLNTLAGPDKTTRLEPKVMQVLVCLAEQAGQVIPKERLIQRVWPDTFVSDDVLTRCVSELRRAFGDDPKDPRFIQTIPRSGYRLIADVVSVDAQEPTPSPPPPPPEKPNKSAWPRSWLAVGLLVSVGVAILAWVSWKRPTPKTEVTERKLTSNSSENSVTSAAISPDGRQLAYSDEAGIYLKLISSGEVHPVKLPAGFHATVDAWFPDGAHLLVSRMEAPGKISLWNLSLFGGAPRRLSDDASGGSVSPDGSHIAFHRGFVNYGGVWGKEEWVMRSDGTDPVKVSAGQSEVWQLGAPTWSPDGKRIAYIRTNWNRNQPTRSIEVNEWREAKADTLVSDSRLDAGPPVLQWLADGRLIYAIAPEQSQQDSTLWAASVQPSGKLASPPRRVATGQGLISQVNGSADGKAVVTLRGSWSHSVYIGTLSRDGAHLVANRRLTLDENENLPVSWTPDSKAVLFASDRNGSFEIFKQPIDQTLAENLVTSENQLWLPRFTPDGSEILYLSTPKAPSREPPVSIFAIPVGGGTPRLVLKQDGIWNIECARLPSTMCLYSTSRGSIWETFRFDVRSGKIAVPPQIDGVPTNWALSPDGAERAIIDYAPDVGVVKFRSTSTGTIRQVVLKGWNGLMGLEWSADGKSVLIPWHNFEQNTALLSVTRDGKVSVLLKSSNPKITTAIPSPDGRLLAIAEEGGPKNVWRLEGF